MNTMSKKSVILGSMLSTLCFVALVVHLNNFYEIKFDTPALFLLFLALMPWLSLFIENATLPGGWRLEFRRLNKQQEEQHQMADVKFLLQSLAAKWQLVHLKKLNSSERFSYTFSTQFEYELRHLVLLGFIERHSGKGIRSAKEDKRNDNDLKEHFSLIKVNNT